MFLGLAFLVVAAPVVSRCAALGMPTVRLVKGRRLTAQGGGDTWKVRIGACENIHVEQTNGVGILPTQSQETWWRVLFGLTSLSLPSTSVVAVRNFARSCREVFSQQFSAAGNPLRC
jgi:hypothetical protein